MKTLRISLPDPLKKFIDQQVAGGAYSTASEYICSLLRAEQDRQAELETLRRDVQIGIDQADRGEFSSASAANIKAKGRRLLARRKERCCPVTA